MKIQKSNSDSWIVNNAAKEEARVSLYISTFFYINNMNTWCWCGGLASVVSLPHQLHKGYLLVNSKTFTMLHLHKWWFFEICMWVDTVPFGINYTLRNVSFSKEDWKHIIICKNEKNLMIPIFVQQNSFVPALVCFWSSK